MVFDERYDLHFTGFSDRFILWCNSLYVKKIGEVMLQNLIGPATQLLDKFIEDKDQKMALAHEISTMAERHAQELAKGQIEVNKMEAASSNMFVAGWRPAGGWPSPRLCRSCNLVALCSFSLVSGSASLWLWPTLNSSLMSGSRNICSV